MANGRSFSDDHDDSFPLVERTSIFSLDDGVFFLAAYSFLLRLRLRLPLSLVGLTFFSFLSFVLPLSFSHEYATQREIHNTLSLDRTRRPGFVQGCSLAATDLFCRSFSSIEHLLDSDARRWTRLMAMVNRCKRRWPSTTLTTRIVSTLEIEASR